MAKSNSSTKTKTTKKSSGGFLIGIALIIFGSIILANNEKDAVKNIKTVDELKKNVVDIKSTKYDKKNDGKLVAITGKIEVDDDKVIDTSFNVSVKTAKLDRIVEMYQYEEEEGEDEKENASYTYNKVWSEKLIDSNEFGEAGHINPSNKRHDSKSILAKNVRIGKYKLDEEQIERLSTTSKYTFDEKTNYRNGYKVIDNYLTNSTDYENPKIGDFRISYKYNNTKKVSILAKLDGDTFENYVSKSGKTINKVYEGSYNSTQMIEKIDKSNKTSKWFKRLGGAIIIIIGYSTLISLITTLAEYVPVLGKIISSAMNLIMSLIGIIHSLIVIIISWFRYRPLMCVLLLLVVLVIVFLIKKLKDEKK